MRTLNGFCETQYTSNTSIGINKIYDDLILYCKNCKVEKVETKMDIQDYKCPTFVVLRKNYCYKCWLRYIVN